MRKLQPHEHRHVAGGDNPPPSRLIDTETEHSSPRWRPVWQAGPFPWPGDEDDRRYSAS